MSKLTARAALLHPVICIGPWVGLCLLGSLLPHSDPGDVMLGIYAVLVGSLLSVAWTLARVKVSDLAAGAKVAVVAIGVAGSLVMAVVGVILVIEAADIACRGRYECPF